MTRRNKGFPIRWFPQCDRCGRPAHPTNLTDDGLGHICPPCAIGGAKTRKKEGARA